MGEDERRKSAPTTSGLLRDGNCRVAARNENAMARPLEIVAGTTPNAVYFLSESFGSKCRAQHGLAPPRGICNCRLKFFQR